MAPSLRASIRRDSLYLDKRFVGDYWYRRAILNLDAGRTLGRMAELRLGAFGGHFSTEWASGLFPVPKQNDWKTRRSSPSCVV